MSLCLERAPRGLRATGLLAYRAAARRSGRIVGWEAVVVAGLGLAFAVSIGAHYTGACMGMAYAGGALSRRAALALMAVLAFLGAAFASGRVVANIGLRLVPDGSLTLGAAGAVVGIAFALTTCYNRARLPTSTIQILVFTLIGVALAAGIGVGWSTLGALVLLWALAPVAAAGLGYVLARGAGRPSLSAVPVARRPVLAAVLVTAGAVASFAMGANDVANAVAVFVTTHIASLLIAGIAGGAAIAAGVLTWGRPLLEKIASDIVHLDPELATAAQLGQGVVVVFCAVVLGSFTSMNQALVGAMAGAGLARGRSTVEWGSVRAILIGWAVGPVSGLAGGAAAATILRLAGVPL